MRQLQFRKEKNKGGGRKHQNISKDILAEGPEGLDASVESAVPPTTEESVPSEEASGGQGKYVSSISVTSLTSL